MGFYLCKNCSTISTRYYMKPIFCKAPTDFMNINDRGVPKGDFNFAKKRAERRA